MSEKSSAGKLAWLTLRTSIDVVVGLILLSQAMMVGFGVVQMLPPEVVPVGVAVVAGLTIWLIVERTNRRDDPRFTKPPPDPR